MPNNDVVQNLIDRLIACDEQPDREQMAELRQRLGQKVVRMKRRGHSAMLVCLVGGVMMFLGYVCIALAFSGPQDIVWLTRIGFTVVILGAIVTVTGCVGLLLFRGFGYVWARHDFQETAITELSVHIQELSHRVDELAKQSRSFGQSHPNDQGH